MLIYLTISGSYRSYVVVYLTVEMSLYISDGTFSRRSNRDNSLNSLLEKEEFSTSKVTERNESTDIALETVLENDFYHLRFII